MKFTCSPKNSANNCKPAASKPGPPPTFRMRTVRCAKRCSVDAQLQVAGKYWQDTSCDYEAAVQYIQTGHQYCFKRVAWSLSTFGKAASHPDLTCFTRLS